MGSIPHIYRRAFFRHRATPRKLPPEGNSYAPDTREGISAKSDSRPKRFRCFNRSRKLSSTDLRLNFMHRSRMRIQRSRLRYALPQSDHRVAK